MSAAPHIAVDVLVVGLGPAGASAAAEAARRGLKVLAIERNAEPGLPVQCAEFVPQMIGQELTDFGDARIQPIDRMDTFVSQSAPFLTPDFKGYMIDRAQFDQHLIEQAIMAGADTRFATPLRSLAPDGTANIGGGLIVRAKTVIGADGPRSPVGKAIGASNAELVETRQITVDLKVPHTATDIFLRPDIVGGYAWLFPRGGLANLGLGVVPGRKGELKTLLDRLHAQLIGEGRVGEQIHRHTGGLIPVGGMTGPTARLNKTQVFLCGDAAGLTNPITGAGIATAVISGRLAGEAAALYVGGDQEAAGDYAEELTDIFGPSLDLALTRRHQIMAAFGATEGPGDDTLRQTWIAFPQYWDKKQTGPRPLGNSPELEAQHP